MSDETDLAWLFDLDRDSGELERQIYRRILGAVLDQRLKPGARLPASRKLAEELGVSRGTVVGAYDQLIAEGYLEAQTGRGTTVASLPPHLLADAAQTAGSGPQPPTAQGVGAMMELTTSGGIRPRCFPLGIPDLDVFPRREWTRCLIARVRRLQTSDLTYDNAAGLPILRQALIEYLNRARGVVADPEQVVVVPSAQAAFAAVADAAIDPKDAVAVEDPGYRNARNILAANGASLLPIHVDDEGIDTDRLAKHDAFRVVAVTPSHQFPTGVTMSLKRRLQLLEIARARRAYILEDDYDSEFRYTERPIASLQGLGNGDNVVYVGTFSKSLAPGLRVAYLVAPPHLAPILAATIAGKGQIVPAVVQAAMADFITEGYLAAHIGRMRAIYGKKRDTLVAALRAALPDTIPVDPPRGGLQMLLKLPAGTNDVGLVDELAAEGIATRPLSGLTIRSRERGLLLGFALPKLDEIDAAARRMGEVVRARLGG
ncbi:PLP-dependent aminotransferase family protein [Bauldia sp.]|uniref:MocR-like pyridoxine biosynthesis transcription factor PdxR n=1 Tax=Bauldia sp. TaxID=2575872 RepID=UPI003BAB600E